MRKTFKPVHKLRYIKQSEGVMICTEVLSTMAGYFEHGNEHSGSIIRRSFLTICLTKNFLRSSGNKFHFTFLHACTIHMNYFPLLCLTCWCVIFFFQRTVFIPDGWGGRFWARTGCNFDGSGQGPCATGDCGNKLECNGAGGVPPVTLAEIKLNGDGGNDFYDVSYVDGFNVPVRVSKFLG